MAWFGTRAHGNVTRRELLGAGLSASAIRRRVAKGGLIPQYDGVYRVGHAAPSREARPKLAVTARSSVAARRVTRLGW